MHGVEHKTFFDMRYPRREGKNNELQVDYSSMFQVRKLKLSSYTNSVTAGKTTILRPAPTTPIPRQGIWSLLYFPHI